MEVFIKKKIFNVKGQMAIFMVLIFQILFILFAMSLNVALVVHDKINLQNSLDLASYYGAKKQAEVLNAMAHINYQMRQNWKLLAWRYRILGNLGHTSGIHQKSSSSLPYWCPQNKERNIDCSKINPKADPQNQILLGEAREYFKTKKIYPDYYDQNYFLCISHNLWKRGIIDNSSINICTTNSLKYPVPKIEDVPQIADFLPETRLVRELTQNLQDQVATSCELEGALNWLMTQLFLTHFRLDQRDRKMMMQKVYEKTLKQGRDLDGNSIIEGAKKVFKKNLTQSNRESFAEWNEEVFKEYNSFQAKNFEDIFQEVEVFPVLQYLDSNSNQREGGECTDVPIESHISFFNKPDFFTVLKEKLKKEQHYLYEAFKDRAYLKNLFEYNKNLWNSGKSPISNLTLSFIKKTDFVLYYGLKVEFKAISNFQIFSLNKNFNFKASSFAKAFGAQFGPSEKQRDPMIPVRIGDHINDLEINPYILQPNYSRWPGDIWGLLDPIFHEEQTAFLMKYNPLRTQKKKFSYSIDAFLHRIFYEGFSDPLARPIQDQNLSTDPMGFMRLMEWMAVVPDLYDLSYYSISANYMKTYFPKICKLLNASGESHCDPGINHKIQNSKSSFIRGDFGWPDFEIYLKKNQEQGFDLSIAPLFLIDLKKDLMNLYVYQNDVGLKEPFLNELTSRNIFYPWFALNLPGDILSSWTPPRNKERYKDYTVSDKDGFLECIKPALKDKPNPNSCVIGGRSGYSIKLISCEAVREFKIQPDNLQEYCEK